MLEARPGQSLPTRMKGKYPDAWLTVTAYMRDLELSVINTDQAYLMDGRASQEHIDNLRKNNIQPLPIQTVDNTLWISFDLHLPNLRAIEPTSMAKMRFIRGTTRVSLGPRRLL